MKCSFLFLSMLLATFSKGQNSNENSENEDTIFIVEQFPEFSGGDSALLDYLGSIKYPTEALENYLEGTVYVRYIVTENGEIDSVEVAKSSGHSVLDSAAIEHARNMPPYNKPGIQNNKPVRVQYIFPFKFYFVDGPTGRKKKKSKG